MASRSATTAGRTSGTPPPPPYPYFTGSGHGLIGMRERAHLCGGTLNAGPLPGGGFRVWARLPTPVLAAAQARAVAPEPELELIP
ncbi:MAG TPA: hypothetical protein VMG38_16455 [Trebonia sp.]|nr:hypothetical protein [Trebonia sp.]